jgi:hypothetical protein
MMTEYATQTLSEALAEKIKIPASRQWTDYIFAQATSAKERSQYIHVMHNDWLIDDTKRMAELAVEYEIDSNFILLTNGNEYVQACFYPLDRLKIKADAYFKDHPSKLHAWRWAIGLALMEIEL